MPRGNPSSCERKGARRIITTGIVWLLLGAIVNVAVAWGCALWASPRDGAFVHATKYVNSSRLDPAYGSLHVWRMTRAGAMDIKVNRWRGGHLPAPDESPLSLIPEWTQLREPSEAYKAGALAQWARGGVGAEVAIVEVRGWPLLGMWTAHGVTVPSNGIWTRHGLNTGLMRDSVELNGAAYPIALPLRPRLVRFAVNSVLYAAVIAIAVIGTQAMRRWRRIKRRLCPTCAYPIGSSEMCTECGKAVKARSVELGAR